MSNQRFLETARPRTLWRITAATAAFAATLASTAPVQAAEPSAPAGDEVAFTLTRSDITPGGKIAAALIGFNVNANSLGRTQIMGLYGR